MSSVPEVVHPQRRHHLLRGYAHRNGDAETMFGIVGAWTEIGPVGPTVIHGRLA